MPQKQGSRQFPLLESLIKRVSLASSIDDVGVGRMGVAVFDTITGNVREGLGVMVLGIVNEGTIKVSADCLQLDTSINNSVDMKQRKIV